VGGQQFNAKLTCALICAATLIFAPRVAMLDADTTTGSANHDHPAAPHLA
jgi:hypothetical protein